MCTLKSSVFVLLAVASSTLAAPKPLDLEEIGRTVRNFGQKALPAVKGVCGFVNAYQGYPPVFPQNPGFPQQSGYPQVPQSYPQYPYYFQQFPQNLNPSSAGFPPNYPPVRKQIPTVEVSEQDDLNKSPSSIYFKNPQNVPPQIQDVFKNFDKLPKFDDPAVNTATNDKFIDWRNSNDNVI